VKKQERKKEKKRKKERKKERKKVDVRYERVKINKPLLLLVNLHCLSK